MMNIGNLKAKFQNTEGQKENSTSFQRELIGHIHSIRNQNDFLTTQWEFEDCR